MAKFPIYTTERSLPGVGPAAYGRLDADTGAGAVARAVGQAGGALADVGMTIFRAQGEAELTEKMAEAAQKVSEMHLRFEQNLDETTYQQDFDQTFGEIENMEFKNGWARRQWNLRLPMMRQRQQELAKEAYHKRIRWKWDQAYTNEKAKAIETGNLGNFNALLQSGHDKGFFTQDFVESERRDTKRLAQRREIIALLSSDPSKVKGLDNWEEFHSHYRHQIPEDFRYFQGLKQAQEAWMNAQQTQQQIQYEQGLWDLTGKPQTTTNDIFRYIDQLPPELYTPSEKDKLLKSTVARLDLMAKGNGDPLRVRQDYEAYRDLLWDAEDNNLTEERARAAVNANKITIADYHELKNIIEKGGDSQSDVYSFKNVVKRMENMLDANISYLPAREEAKLKGFMLLENEKAVAEAKGEPLGDRELMEKMLRIQADLVEEAKRRTYSETMLPLPPARRVPYTKMRTGEQYVDGKPVGRLAVPPSLPMANPTAEELRRRNTREAYEQGVALGYWK